MDHRHLVESVKLQDFAVASTQCAFSIDSVDQCALGTFRVGPLVGEIAAWGDATGIDADSVTLHCNSLKALCGVHTQCVMRATGDANPKEANVVFIAEDVVVAVAVVAMKSEVKDICLDGTCAWEYVLFAHLFMAHMLTLDVDSLIRHSSRKYPRIGRRLQR